MDSRRTLTFYRYVKITDPAQLRLELSENWKAFDVLGRTYLSEEGINAQVSVPTAHLESFANSVRLVFPGIPIKAAVEERGESFKKLRIKVRSKIVTDGLNDSTFDASQVGQHLSARQFNEAIADPQSIVIDMRNHYESEVGHFQNAYLPKANTFREALPEVKSYLADKKDRKILLYCTGGIRCEKASAWLKHQGFEDVSQLHGGIVDYARQIQAEQLPSLFKGVNFVFDDRLGERITADVIANCHQCGRPCDTQLNCRNSGCNLLFIQCESCHEEFDGCCSFQCRDILNWPREEQVRLQNEWEKKYPKFLRSRRRLDLKALKEAYLSGDRSIEIAQPLSTEGPGQVQERCKTEDYAIDRSVPGSSAT